MSDQALYQEPPGPARPHTFLATIVFVLAVLAGVSQVLGALRDPSKLQVPWNWSDFWQGHTTQKLEKQIDHHMPARERIIAWANSARYLIIHGGGEQVRVGRDDWLFLTEELRYAKVKGQPLQARADLLRDASQALAGQGVRLLVALVPDKARVQESYMAFGHYPDANRPRYTEGLEALRQRQVAVVDLLTPMAKGATAEPVYYRSDTHWNQRGAEIAAQEIARTAQGMRLQLDPASFETTLAAAPVERAGDLIRMMGLEHMPNALRPTPDREAPATTRKTSASGGGGLLGDSAVPVTLVGTSYSLRGNFHGYLQQALQAEVLNTAKDGGGFLQAMTDYLKDESFRSAKPKLLIWELPERFLKDPLDKEPDWLSQVGLTSR